MSVNDLHYFELPVQRYVVDQEFHFQLPFPLPVKRTIKLYDRVFHDVLVGEISPSGAGVLYRGFRFEPSGPTKDTNNSIRPSAEHDANYWSSRIAPHLSDEERAAWRKLADDWMEEQLKQRGMSKLRRFFWKRGLRWFGGSSADPAQEPRMIVRVAD